MVKNLPDNAGDAGSITGLGRSPGEGNGNPLQFSWPGKSHGQRNLAALQGVAESDIAQQLNNKGEKGFAKEM